MKLGFIGCGNMASAIIKGIADNSKENHEIFAYDCYEPALDNTCESYGVIPCYDECSVVDKADIIFLAVKPNVLSSVLEKIKNNVTEQKLLISIAAGKTIEFISNHLNDNAKIVRVMPNINAKVSEAVSAYCYNANVSENDCSTVEKLLNCTGSVISLTEDKFAIFGVIGGCSPAFAYMFIDALARAGVQNGMKKDEALKIAAQAVYGSAKMIMESDKHPWELVDNVCSPGGTTIEGVTSLQNDGFEAAINNAVNKAFEKDSRL